MAGLDQAPPPARITLVLGCGARSGQERPTADGPAGRPRPGPGSTSPTPRARDAEDGAGGSRRTAPARPGWRTVEAPRRADGDAGGREPPRAALLVDCLTLWLSNIMEAGRDIAAETRRLTACLGRLEGRTVLVSNEVGLGIVPENAAARAFRDHAGRLNQAVAQAAERVVFVAAGLPLTLKP